MRDDGGRLRARPGTARDACGTLRNCARRWRLWKTRIARCRSASRTLTAITTTKPTRGVSSTPCPSLYQNPVARPEDLFSRFTQSVVGR